MNVVEITWVDSLVVNYGEWMDADEVPESMTVEAMLHKSVGYIVSENELAIALAGSQNIVDHRVSETKDRVCGVTVIPVSCITNRSDIKTK